MVKNKIYNSTNHSQVLVYIIYGNNCDYYQGAVVSLLSFLASWQDNEPPFIVILTEQIKWFVDLPVLVLPLSVKQKAEWSLNGTYYFRIKNRGLLWVIDTLLVKQYITPRSKILFCDTDTYFPKSPAPLYDLLDDDGVVMFLCEHRIGDKKRLHGYLHDLQGKTLQVSPTLTYCINPKSYMWGSLLIGMTADKRAVLDEADALMLAMLPHCTMHTIEQFCLAEMLGRHYHLQEGKHWVSHYSRPNQKDWVMPQISACIAALHGKSLSEKMALVQRLRFRRPLTRVIQQKLAKSRWE